MIEDILRSYLLQRGIGATIYLGFQAAEPDTAITLTSTPGLAPDAQHQYNNTGLQVRTRANEYESVFSLSWAVCNALHSLHTQTISGVWFVDIQAQQDPFSLGRDEQNRAMFAQNFLIDYYRELANRV